MRSGGAGAERWGHRDKGISEPRVMRVSTLELHRLDARLQPTHAFKRQCSEHP